jgi:hypothetical protein
LRQKKGRLNETVVVHKRNLPHELEDKLTAIPRGYVRLQVGGDIILMNKKTEVIVDIIHDIG